MNADHFRNGFPYGLSTFKHLPCGGHTTGMKPTIKLPAAPQAVIMLKNERDVLPLKSSKVRSSKNRLSEGTSRNFQCDV